MRKRSEHFGLKSAQGIERSKEVKGRGETVAADKELGRRTTIIPTMSWPNFIFARSVLCLFDIGYLNAVLFYLIILFDSSSFLLLFYLFHFFHFLSGRKKYQPCSL
jgi:hypothetical protein